MRKLISAFVVGTLLSACATLNTAAQPVNMDTANKAAYTAKATYAGALVVAAQIVKMPRCEVAPAPCVPRKVVNQIRKADLAADATTQAAEDAVRNLGSDPMIVQAAIEAATQAVAAFKVITSTYGGK